MRRFTRWNITRMERDDEGARRFRGEKKGKSAQESIGFNAEICRPNGAVSLHNWDADVREWEKVENELDD